jgi:hypothetical protein
MKVAGLLLPVELLSMIVAYFAKDKAELAKLSLVSWKWLLPARFHYFRALRFRQNPDEDDLSAFHHFIQAPLGRDCATFVERLWIEGKELPGNEFYEPTLDIFKLGNVVSKLPRLVDVTLDRVRWTGVPSYGPAPPFSESVRLLIVARMTTWFYEDLKDGSDIFHIFPGVKQFETIHKRRQLNATGREHRLPLPKDYRSFPKKLQPETFVFRAFGPPSPFLDYALHTIDLSHLTSLSLWRLLPKEIRFAGALLTKVKSTLRYLELNLYDTFIPVHDSLREFGYHNFHTHADFRSTAGGLLGTVLST